MRLPFALLALTFSLSLGAIMASCGASAPNDGIFGAGGASSGTGSKASSGTSTSTGTLTSSGTGILMDGGTMCVPKTCAELNANCGPMADGCMGIIQCGTCKAPESCGGGKVPSVCGNGGGCTPKTCAGLGLDCGPVGDGCGGLLQCGSCTLPATCGGGGQPSVCGPLGDGGMAPCVNLCKQQKMCGGNVTTTVTGTVYAPNGVDPIYDALVYVPNSPVLAFTKGVACDKCGEAASGSPLVTAVSGSDGTFQLQNVPVGANIPLVIQLGRWRVQTVIPNVLPCQDNPVGAALTHLPQNKAQGDIPLMAMVTGSADPLECVLRKIGISDAEFTLPAAQGGNGRVQLWMGNGADGPNGGAPPESTLESNPSTLAEYDMVILACEGQDNEQPALNQAFLMNYSDVGGRVFATHYSYVWLYNDAPFSTTATWAPDVSINDPPPDPVTAIVDQTFPKGMAFAKWLQVVGASPTPGQISISAPRKDFTAVNSMLGQQWLYWNDTPENLPQAPLHYTFNTTVAAPAAQQCGRVVYSDFHVNQSQGFGTNFPSECDNSPMTPQEHVLEFMLFDLSSCITPDIPKCAPLTCAAQGFTCGPQGDGCGNEIMCGSCPNGQNCGGGGKPGVCGGMPCVPKTCAEQKLTCGAAGDGCGGLLQCGTCMNGQICGGGGTPGVCGGSMNK